MGNNCCYASRRKLYGDQETEIDLARTFKKRGIILVKQFNIIDKSAKGKKGQNSQKKRVTIKEDDKKRNTSSEEEY